MIASYIRNLAFLELLAYSLFMGSISIVTRLFNHSTKKIQVIDPRRLRFLFQKQLQNSDVSSLRRMVLPKVRSTDLVSLHMHFQQFHCTNWRRITQMIKIKTLHILLWMEIRTNDTIWHFRKLPRATSLRWRPRRAFSSQCMIWMACICGASSTGAHKFCYLNFFNNKSTNIFHDESLPDVWATTDISYLNFLLKPLKITC